MYFIPGCAMGHAYIVDNSPWSKYIIFYIYILHISYFAPNIIFLVQWGRIDILLTAPSCSKWPHLNIETSVPSQPNANPIIGLSIYFKYPTKKCWKSVLYVYFSLQSMQHVQFTHLNAITSLEQLNTYHTTRIIQCNVCIINTVHSTH